VSDNKRVAIVTGANRGIGKEIARQLAPQGFRVIATSRDHAQGLQMVAELAGDSVAVSAFTLDVTDAVQRQQLFDYVRQEYGRCDVLVNNAGVALDKWVPGLETDLDVLRETMEVNVYGVLALSQLFVPLMKQNSYGRVVNLSSELASLSNIDMAGTLAYRSSKAALNAVTCLLALEVAGDNVLINAAAPGWVATELGGYDAPRSTAEGAQTPVWLATLPDDGPRGGFYRDKEVYPW
jgi:NAD(P)-dependent dehydrogenase (short-subunit alcohol dehydrogenase family)